MPEPKLTDHEITENYYAGYQLALDVIRRKQRAVGFDLDTADPEYLDLAQSVFGSERLIRLIQTERFDAVSYGRIIAEEIDKLSKELFPDVGKRRFVSLDKLHDEYSVELEADDPIGFVEPVDTISPGEVLDYLRSKLSADNFAYVRRLFDQQTAGEREFAWNDKIYRLIDQSIDYLDHKVSEMRRLYPDANPFQQDQLVSAQALTREEIIGCYKNVYLGIYPKFPVNFLTYDAPWRCAILTQYAVEHILQESPLDVLKGHAWTDFAAIGLRGVVRFFNYSLNRMIRHAYPDVVLPWEAGHVEDGFWDDASNRTMAIRWLIEEKLKIPRNEIPKALREDRIQKSTFADHGLSYLYVKHYKSVSRCVGAAYPDLMPWELGSVPNSFWQGDEGQKRIVQAVHWMIRQLRIPVASIPDRIRDRTISRHTFAAYGLSTVFERLYKKNTFQLINAAFPGLFEIWEIGKVPVDYWDDLIHAYRAAWWVARKEGVRQEELLSAIVTQRLKKDAFSKYNLGGMLKKCFQDNLRKAYLPYLLPKKQETEALMRDVVLLSALHRQVRQFRPENNLLRAAKILFFPFVISSANRRMIRYFDRMKKRIQGRMDEWLKMVP